MPKYIPPHLRVGYVPEPVRTLMPVLTRRGVHYKSQESGVLSHDIHIRVFDKNAPLKTSRQVKLRHLLSRKKIRSVLKGKSKKVGVRSAEYKKSRVTRKRKRHTK